MNSAKYVVVGSSHAALEAVASIRAADEEGTIALITRDANPPYSPTVLPYVVSGKSEPGRVTLRPDTWYTDNRVTVVAGRPITEIDPQAKTVMIDGVEAWGYDKLLLATGAVPAIPPVKGIHGVPYHVLRTMDDAVGLKDAIGAAKRAVVLGGGLVGMHGAENLHKGGLDVTIIERESRVLAAYFDADAAGLIEGAFSDAGITMRLGTTVTSAERQGEGVRLGLDDGTAVDCDLLLVATGVKPAIDYLDGSGIESETGILVDPRMRTSVADIWAAGDVAQARDFYDAGRRTVTGILPAAVEQGRIAGMDMAGDRGLKPFPGGVPINTYTFFGQRAVSVGLSQDAPEMDIDKVFDAATGQYRKILIKDGCLVGISGINSAFDPGVMWELILRRVDLAPVRAEFVQKPLETGRTLMSSLWR